MKKFLLDILALAGIALVSISSVSHVAFSAEVIEKPEYKAVVNGIELESQTYENIDHAHMYPVREMSEILGYTVEWNDEEKSCLVSSETVPSVKFYIGEDKYIYGADAVAELKAVPEIKDGRSYVPSTFFSKFFSLDMRNMPDGTVNITSPVEVQLKENEANIVKIGDLFSVKLEENASTGYAWTVEHDGDMQLIKTITDQAMNNGTEGIVGAPSMKTWIFKCDEPGEYKIKYTYERSFEKNSAAETHEYKITVE